MVFGLSSRRFSTTSNRPIVPLSHEPENYNKARLQVYSFVTSRLNPERIDDSEF